FTINDYVAAGEQTAVELHFHCHPECDVKKSENGYQITRANIKIEICGDSSLSTEFFSGSHDPVLGWYSPEFNKLTKSSTIRFSQNRIKEKQIVTMIML
ncbi:MAG: heparinase II/III family protein, partial [Thermodesulfobacteriota bacterium]|nr:heparinase II/III family protein [Thermodesulfobacteriota bacterium]